MTDNAKRFGNWARNTTRKVASNSWLKDFLNEMLFLGLLLLGFAMTDSTPQATWENVRAWLGIFL